MNWINWFRSEFKEFNDKYDSLLNRYSANMQPDLVEVIESIKNSVFHQHMISFFPMLEVLNKNAGHATPDDMFGQMFTHEYVIQPYLDSLKSLLNLASHVEIMQNFFKIDDASWRNDVAPAIGSSRV